MKKLVNNNWVTNSFTDCLIKLAKKNKKIVVLDADLSDDVNLKKFEKKYPKRFIQNGIAEQDMVSMAGGIALTGLVPVVNSFASFLTARANEQIYNNATELTKIIYMNLYAGILPAGAGKSHQSLRDIALLASIPNIKIYHPYNSIETREILKYCVNNNQKENSAIRLSIGPPPENSPNLPDNYLFQAGTGSVLTEGEDCILFTYGQTMVNEAFKSYKHLKSNNINLKIINMPCINQFKKNWLKNVIGQTKHIFFLEDHNINGGLSDLMSSFFMENSICKNKSVYKFGVKNFPACGTPAEVLKHHGLDYLKVSSTIKNILNK